MKQIDKRVSFLQSSVKSTSLKILRVNLKVGKILILLYRHTPGGSLTALVSCFIKSFNFYITGESPHNC